MTVNDAMPHKRNRCCEVLRASGTTCLVTMFCALTPLHAEEAPAIMPNGYWTVTASPPSNAASLCPEYMPTGTLLRLQVGGPTRLAIEEQRNNELGGSLTLLAPVLPTICSTGLGATTGFGLNLCEGSGLRDLVSGEWVFDDAVFTFSRLSPAQVNDPDLAFFASRGARSGARFMLLTLRDKGVEWQLWLKSAKEMVSECVTRLPGKDNFDSFPMHWKAN
jgi:hypothetical protein